MQIGFLTDGLGHLPFPQALDLVSKLGLTQVEIATGNWSSAPHIDLDAVVNDPAQIASLRAQIEQRGLHIEALNASGNVLHPASGPDQDRVVRKTILLAEQLGVSKIVMMSGLPAVNPGDQVAPWITTCWPPENGHNLEKQWQAAAEYWQALVPFANDHGVTRIAVEMHADQLVYNVPTLLRLRELAGDTVGANFDPSHLMWMGAEPIESVKALKGAIHHVHAKDTKIEPLSATRSLLETNFFDRREERAWNYVTLGEGHPRGLEFWGEFCAALRTSGYDGVLSIEHEDVAYAPEEGLDLAVTRLREAMSMLEHALS
ncbi:sugar phosphate isomerase/epimerase family protein [Gulosibacter chungangensis]|uniref:Sugar phosphate isomerase/epimerase n=1 Tax=Gulosibacter chungangensis TaxID=979746 RepID=A0A7J5BA87_9MICO|nr:sugar phosphate isomerase/epimerase [Gulosibacter chungangensis]KAB1642700.1 sugar phosphate isomerase/epimerase [Gulosibacter chungangensis]